MSDIPNHILAIGERLRTQDNLATSHPLFCVQQMERIYGADDGDHEWRGEDWEAADEAKAKELDDLEECGRDIPEPWHKVYYRDQWRTVMTCLTRVGAQAYIDANGHNLRGDGQPPRIYVESAWRCQEMIQLREWLMSLPSPQPLPTNHAGRGME